MAQLLDMIFGAYFKPQGTWRVPVPSRPTQRMGIQMSEHDRYEWQVFIWAANNIYYWTQRREQGKRRSLRETEKGASMSEAEIDKAVKVSTFEWLINWTREKITGRAEYPDPVSAPDGFGMTDEALTLREKYTSMRSIYPEIYEAKFCWEQVDGWDICIKLHQRTNDFVYYRTDDEGEIIGGNGWGFKPAVSRQFVLHCQTICSLDFWISAIIFVAAVGGFSLWLKKKVAAGEMGAELLFMGLVEFLVPGFFWTCGLPW